jgi:SH3-like domain-containing protein
MKRILFIVLLCMIGVFVAVAKDTSTTSKSSDSLPRFVSLRDDTVNARSGPGTKYPIDWIYKQKSAPVEVIAEFESWRRIRDWQGSESWVKSQLLTRKRFVKVITPGENNLYAKDNYKSKIIARIEDGVVGEIKKCPADNDFCQINFGNYEGWISRQNIYGVYDKEIID